MLSASSVHLSDERLFMGIPVDNVKNIIN